MRLTKYLPLALVLVAAARAHAQEPVRAAGPGLAISPASLLETGSSGPRLGLAPLPAGLRVASPDWSAWGSAPEPWSAFLGYTEPVRGVTAETGEADSPRHAVRELELPDLLHQATDLTLRVEGRGGLGGSWNRFLPCDPSLGLQCQPGLMPQLRPDIEFGVQVGGSIAERIHVNVDYDQRREFDGANNIHVHYQGRPGEVLQRLEMGDVSIALPPSRYMTQGIPVGNFGFKATAHLGATEVEAVWAQQRGQVAMREFRLGGAAQAGLVQEHELVLDDADYASGQFFFVVDPARIDGWPHVDVLRLVHGDAPAAVRPRSNRLVVYRDEGPVAARQADQAREGKFLANAVTADGLRRHSGLFRLLEPGVDYYVHPSGLWIALRAPLRDDEALAASYVTETGVVVGDPSPESRPPGETPELLMIRAPTAIHQPGQPTWDWEMHQVYRLDGSAEVDLSTLELVVSLGHEAGGATFREHAGTQITLLRLFGLDESSPTDRLDEARVFRPGAEFDAIGPTALRGTFVVFPTLEPFARPPPVPSAGLTAAGAAAVLGADANAAIYEAVDPVTRRGAGRFRLNFRYRVRLDGVPSSFNLGAFGIRQGSERITVDDRLLVRGVDYVLDYDIGLVTLLDPHATLGTNPDAEIRATWEQRSVFDVAPKTVVGLHARSPLGPYGELSLVGLYQTEQAMVRRPQLGMAPRAVLLGGMSGRLALNADWLAAALGAVPLLRADSVARFDLTGELALSSPEPNRRGDTYLDDFEATDEIPLSLEAHEWRLGSAPQDPAGVPGLPWPLTPQNAASIVWQDRYLDGGRQVGFLTAQEIDQQITFAGARVAERVLYITLAGESPPEPAPHWRSITTVLSTTGRDLSRSEFLEFYVSAQDLALDGAQLVIDIGTVSEDAFYFDGEFRTSGVDGLGRPWGLGVLDEEASLANREVWGPEHDRIGIWAQRCEADRVNPVALGDPRANCTVNNGRRDTEDLNGNGVLDPFDGPAFRYVVPISRESPYLVRDRSGTGTGFRLFRVPLRGPDALPMHGASEATWRNIQHMRVTVVKPRGGRGTMALARVRIAGSRWTKREGHGIMRGGLSDLPGAGAGLSSVRVGPVSRVTDGAAYESPPGVEDELQDPKSAIGASGAEFNEKGLRLSWDGLLGDERAEVYYRYPQQPRSFLEYRQIRFWAVPRSGSWGPGGDHRLQLRVGTDSRNYYLFQTPLQPVASFAGVARHDWLPERVVDFNVWFELKAEAERLLIESPGQPVTVWSEDGAYAVVLEDRARAPNLAAVRELTFAVHNAGVGESTGEVWLNDVRLGGGARDPGLAGRVDASLNAGGFLTASASLTGRGARFRQLDDVATHQSRDELAVYTTAELGRLAPESWGVSMPVTVSYARTALDPLFLQGTDVRADALPGLRDTGSSRRRVGVTLRKTTESSNPVLAALVDGTTLRLSHLRFSDHTVTTSSQLDGVEGGIELDRPVARVDVGVLPAFVQAALRWLAPSRLEESDFFDRLLGARLRLTPERVGVSTGYMGQESSIWRYDRVLESPRDLDVVPIQSPRRSLDSGARIAFRPFEALTGRIDVTTGRDILDPERATSLAPEREALGRARSDLAGLPIGWERDRSVITDAAFRPFIAEWLRPSVSWSSRFGQRRDPAHLAVVQAPGGAEAHLQRTFHTDSRWTRGVILDPALALGDALAPLRVIKPIEVTWTDGVGSRFDRELAEPGLAYQLGLGRFDDLRVVDADTASTAVRREAFRGRSGFRIGPAAFLDFGYSDGHTRVQDRHVGRRDQAERSWPDVQLGWREIPVPAALDNVLDRWSVTTGFVRTERTTRLLGDVHRTRSTVDGTVPVELRLGFAGGLSFAYIAALTSGDGLDPTGTTERQAVTHAVDLTGRFTAPFGLDRRGLPDPIRLSAGYDYQAETHCRSVGAGGPDTPCTPFIDHIRRRLNLSMSSLIAQLDVGLQLSYIDRRSFVGTQVGSSQFQLGLFGQFNMYAGER